MSRRISTAAVCSVILVLVATAQARAEQIRIVAGANVVEEVQVVDKETGEPLPPVPDTNNMAFQADQGGAVQDVAILVTLRTGSTEARVIRFDAVVGACGSSCDRVISIPEMPSVFTDYEHVSSFCLRPTLGVRTPESLTEQYVYCRSAFYWFRDNNLGEWPVSDDALMGWFNSGYALSSWGQALKLSFFEGVPQNLRQVASSIRVVPYFSWSRELVELAPRLGPSKVLEMKGGAASVLWPLQYADALSGHGRAFLSDEWVAVAIRAIDIVAFGVNELEAMGALALNDLSTDDRDFYFGMLNRREEWERICVVTCLPLVTEFP